MIGRLIAGENPRALEKLVTSPRKDGRKLVARVEELIDADPGEAFRFDTGGIATLRVGEWAWGAGKLETPTVHALRARLRATKSGVAGTCRLFVLRGRGPLADIAALQAFDDGATVFQVASQFNCLEAPSPRVAPVSHYFLDSTQGPRAAVSAFPAAFLRHYRHQTTDLLSEVAHPRHGYLTAQEVVDPQRLAAELETGYERVRLGVHDGVDVVLGHDWDGPTVVPHPRIAQVFTSSLAAGSYSPLIRLDEPGPWRTVAAHLLRAAYTGTLLAAASLARRRVLLTMVGGGVYGHPPDLIHDAILHAMDELDQAGHALDVVVNVFRGTGDAFADAVRARRGFLIDV